MGCIWTALGNRLETAWKRPTKPNSKRPKDGEIIDEEKSVRWNREEVVRRQKAWDAECSRLKKAQNAEIEHISEAIELQIQEDIKTECNEFDPIYDECRASDFFWATAAVEFAGIDKMTLKEVLAAV